MILPAFILLLGVIILLTIGLAEQKARGDDLKERLEFALKVNAAQADRIEWLLSLPGAPLDADAVGDPDPDYVDPWADLLEPRRVRRDNEARVARNWGYNDPRWKWWEFCKFWEHLGCTIEREQAKVAHNASIDAYLERRGTKGRSE